MPGEDISFVNLILMIGTMASNQLGQLTAARPAPRDQVLPRARETINMLVGLKQRTEGRLSPQEERILAAMITDLQARYARALRLGEKN
jgi:hypothetical protein